MFLGYSLRDWNLRVMLYRLAGQQEGMTFKHWAMQYRPRPDRPSRMGTSEGWTSSPVRVEDFVDALEQRLNTEEPVSP